MMIIHCDNHGTFSTAQGLKCAQIRREKKKDLSAQCACQCQRRGVSELLELFIKGCKTQLSCWPYIAHTYGNSINLESTTCIWGVYWLIHVYKGDLKCDAPMVKSILGINRQGFSANIEQFDYFIVAILLKLYSVCPERNIRLHFTINCIFYSHFNIPALYSVFCHNHWLYNLEIQCCVFW